MRAPRIALVVLGLAAMGIAAPTTAMASDEVPGDMPRLVITVVCTIYSDYLDETVTGMDLALGVNLGQYMPECEMTTEYIDAVQVPAVIVDMPEGALFPACADANDCFVPHTVTVGTGTDVTWTNSDTVLHTVTEPGGLFDSWLLPGEEFTFTFETPGTYMYGCTVHPWASGTVVVDAGGAGEPGPAVAKPEPVTDQSDSSTEIIGLLEEFIDMYKTDGTESFASINEMAQNPDQDVVGWVISPDNVILAHSTSPQFVGFPIAPLLAKAGIPLDELAQAIADAGMPIPLSYPSPDPQGNILYYDSAWVTAYDGYFFMARADSTIESRVQSIVEETIRVYDRDPEGAFDTINSFGSLDPKYPFIVDPETTEIVAHGADSSRVGDTAVFLTDSTVSLEEFRSLNEDEGVWTEYVFFDPSTGLDSSKRSWVVMHGGYLFGSGYYP